MNGLKDLLKSDEEGIYKQLKDGIKDKKKELQKLSKDYSRLICQMSQKLRLNATFVTQEIEKYKE